MICYIVYHEEIGILCRIAISTAACGSYSSWYPAWATVSEASVSFKSAKNKLVGPLNPVPNTADVAVQVKGKGISDAAGLVDGTGTLATLARTTLEDRASGDMTLIDFAVPFTLTVTGGKISVKTSANAVLNTTFGTSLPGCTAIEVISFKILDENGTIFASSGVFLPDIN